MLQTLARPIVAKPSSLAPDPIDVRVGARIRLGRRLAGFSQTKLGEAVGVSFQQMQKYEKGVNRVAASRMEKIAAALGRPIAWFYAEGSDYDAAENDEEALASLAERDVEFLRDLSRLGDRHFFIVKQMAAALASQGAAGQERAA
ncbi:helix-turn-helix domain-containing protein [Chenggangzhangella methanolivorans]|uniref:Helix-turn-helix domain-containing protein n=1 Tax=Chenggangzhangella methanolivorans TaxID=1437009 RepID=A0A9E6UH78_9HYPH|nr:helix-turn-helix transcriptional regulator [Chenggangzhangella methanolivorans]QZN99507.1 helix-turn-helix domain-containing protein [Chenggangzhangella methanolivorans]